MISTGDVIRMIMRLHNSWERRDIDIKHFNQSEITTLQAEDESDRVAVLTEQFDHIMKIRAEIFWKSILERAKLAGFNLAFEKEVEARIKSYHP